MPVNHVLNETIRLIEEYNLSRQDVKYLQTKLLVYNNPKNRIVRLTEGAADIKP